MGRYVRVRVPATTANLGPGFDCLGMALGLYNEFAFHEVPAGADLTRPRVSVQGEGAAILAGSGDNLVLQAVRAACAHLGVASPELTVEINNRIPLARGLGSSATAIVAGVVAANALVGGSLAKHELLRLAITLEGHPDNVAAALLGGLTMAVETGSGSGERQQAGTAEGRQRGSGGKAHSGNDEGDFVYMKFAPPLAGVVVAVPDFEVATRDARAALPAQVPREDAVFNVGRAALLTGALTSGRLDLLGVAMEDRLHQPYRKDLVPGLEAVFAAARRAGAAGAALSGAGPTVMALAAADGPLDEIAEAMVAAFAEAGVTARAMSLVPDEAGAVIVDDDRLETRPGGVAQ